MVVIKFFTVLSFISGVAFAAPQYASVIMDNRSGEILRSRNADTRLHPASLTKMMTLYIAFEAIKKGEI
ncbi:D-alanyl-D-alanine carboxypeptidase, partial [bacterium]|nr:D-alanyl-D-alanine carboxypeptidase [bacterium]